MSDFEGDLGVISDSPSQRKLIEKNKYEANPIGSATTEQFPGSHRREFAKGAGDYTHLVQGRKFDRQTGQPLPFGIPIDTASGEILIPVEIDQRLDPFDLTYRARNVYQIQQLRFDEGIAIGYSHSPQANNLEKFLQEVKDPKLAGLQKYEIRSYINGIGKAALNNGDITTALLALETTNALQDPFVAKEVTNVMKELIKQGQLRLDELIEKLAPYKLNLSPVFLPDFSYHPNEVVQKAPDSNSITPVEIHPKLIPPDPVPIITRSEISKYGVDHKFQHNGHNQLSRLEGPNGSYIWKQLDFGMGIERYAIGLETQLLERAKGAGGLPILFAKVGQESDASYGLVMEMIKGKSLDQVSSQSLTPDRFDLKERFKLLTNLVEAYRATGVIHGDLQTGNIILEEGTNNPRLIDYGTVTTMEETRMGIKSIKDIKNMRLELQKAIDLMFLGIKIDHGNSIPTDEYTTFMGNSLLGRIKQLQSFDEIAAMINQIALTVNNTKAI